MTILPQGELTIERMCVLAGAQPGPATTGTGQPPRRVRRKPACGTRSSGWRWRTGITAIAGSPRSYAGQGFAVNRKRVLRLLQQDNLLCLRQKPFVPVTTDSRHGWRVVPNLARGMVPNGLDQLWVADITYIRLQEEFVYLAIVLDAFSRRVVGWALETHLEASLAIAALSMAIETRWPTPGESDPPLRPRTQYACHDYTELLHQHDIAASMSRVGNPDAQCQGRELREDAQAGGGERSNLPRCDACQKCHRRLHRGGVQWPTAALGAGLPAPCRVRRESTAVRGCCAAAPHRGPDPSTWPAAPAAN